MKPLYPIFLDLAGRQVVVIGAGTIAARKIESFIEADAIVRVVSPEAVDEIAAWVSEQKIEYHRTVYSESHIQDAWLVIAATSDRSVNEAIYRDCCQRRIFCNVVDQPDICSFQVPSVLQRGALKIAVSTSGVSPALSRRIRERLERLIGRHYGRVLEGLQDLRRHVKEKYPDDQKKRSVLLKGFVKSEALDLAEKGDMDRFDELLENWKEK